MKAVVVYETGDLDHIQIADVAAPAAQPGEVVIEVRAAALNHLDIWIRRGRPGVTLPSPHILGSDAAGVIVEVGAGVSTVKAGDDVIVNPGVNCGVCAACLRGQQSECDTYGILGVVRPGTFAERVAVNASNIAAKPAHLSWEEAAALPLAYLTAWRMLFTRARVQPGETVLIHGIGGGVALAALQLAKLGDIRCIVTSSSDDKLARAKEMGADVLLNYKHEVDLPAAILCEAGGTGVDAVVDTTGAGTWPINVAVCRKGGRIVHCGVTSGAAVEANLAAIYWKQLNILGSTMGSHEDFRHMLAAVSEAKLRPVLDKIYPLDQAREAQGRMESGEQFGKIVLRP